jgi:putative ABC transport system permease protein
MLKNYLKIAFRNIIRNKVYSFINIVGLAIGMACSILIFLWVQDELSYEKHHKKANQIFQAYLKGSRGENINFQSTTSPAIAGILKEEYPEIFDVVRIGRLGDLVVKYKDNIISESLGAAADPSVFDIFTYPFLQGEPVAALTDPYSIVLTKDFAEKYFGEENALGKILKINNKYDFKVTGVIQNLPNSSYRKFDFIVPFTFLKELGNDIQGTPFYPCSYLTYGLIEKNPSYDLLNQKVRTRLLSEGKEITFEIELVPLTKTYLLDTGGSQRLYAFSFIAIVILILASINFMNLATARSINRSKEIGMRKVSGANRIQIIKQFLGESLFLTVIAGFFAIFLTEIFLSYFNEYTTKQISINYTDYNFLLSLIGIILITGTFSGLYPAIFLSSFTPINAIKNKLKSGGSKARVRKFLVILQFSLSIFFIICTIIISRQSNYIRNFDLGMNTDNIIYVQLDGDIKNKYTIVKNELLKNPNIYVVCSASKRPNVIRSGSYFQWGVNDDHSRRMCYIHVDYDYLEMFDIKVVEGRFYDKKFVSDKENAIIVNETAIKKVNLQSPVNKPFYFSDRYYNLIGVVKDFQHNSPLNTAPEPLTLILRPEGYEYMFARINSEIQDIHIISSTVEYIKTVCNKFSPDRPLSYKYVNDYNYESETAVQARQKLILYSTILAIIISSLGLFGVSSFMSKQRTKEIGIRKVLGSSIFGVLLLLSKEYLKWVLFASFFACPIAWYVMKKWLQDFAYQVEIGFWVFIFAGGITMLIALITISAQTIKAALANPVESIRYE